VLVHSEKLVLTDDQPEFNVVATLRFVPGCIKYMGTQNNGITSQSYGAYDTSYIVENVRVVPLSPLLKDNSFHK
jgi:hypothetical protein